MKLLPGTKLSRRTDTALPLAPECPGLSLLSDTTRTSYLAASGWAPRKPLPSPCPASRPQSKRPAETRTSLDQEDSLLGTQGPTVQSGLVSLSLFLGAGADLLSTGEAATPQLPRARAAEHDAGLSWRCTVPVPWCQALPEARQHLVLDPANALQPQEPRFRCRTQTGACGEVSLQLRPVPSHSLHLPGSAHTFTS